MKDDFPTIQQAIINPIPSTLLIQMGWSTPKMRSNVHPQVFVAAGVCPDSSGHWRLEGPPGLPPLPRPWRPGEGVRGEEHHRKNKVSIIVY